MIDLASYTGLPLYNMHNADSSRLTNETPELHVLQVLELESSWQLVWMHLTKYQLTPFAFGGDIYYHIEWLFWPCHSTYAIIIKIQIHDIYIGRLFVVNKQKTSVNEVIESSMHI